MKLKRIIALFAAVLLAAVLPMTALAKTWSAEDFTLTVPEEFQYTFDLSTPEDDPGWVFAGVSDPASRLKDYQEMNILADFYTENGETNIILMTKETDDSNNIFNLKDLSEEDKEKFLAELATTDTEGVSLEKSYIDVNGQPFYKMVLDAKTDEVEAHDVTCGTIINGYAVTIEMYNGSKEITEEQLALMDSLVGSMRITAVREKPEPEPVNYTPILVSIAVLLVVVLGPIIYIPVRNRRDKKQKAQMAERLSEYRKENSKDTVSGEVRFVNATDCTREAIHDFSVYHAYIKNAPSLALGAAMCVLVLAVAFLMDLTWWLKVLAVGVTIYFGYRAFSMGSNVEKIQRKVFQRGVSETARYTFYDDAFRVAGIQSGSVYPYFQITGIRRHGHYLYLYYGPDNAYLVDQYGFEVGEFEDFEKFIREKTEKKS